MDEFSRTVEGDFYRVDVTGRHMHAEFAEPMRTLSSAVLNGGFQKVRHALNMRVDENYLGCRKDFEGPEETLLDYSRRAGWGDSVLGMMTSAEMTSFRTSRAEEDGVVAAVFLTAGVSNAKRAGEKAEMRRHEEPPKRGGTINIVLVTNALLTDAAMAETLMVMTEAKAAVLHDLGVKSPYSGLTATGTGTDSAAVVSGRGPVRIRFCGKHTLFGEMAAVAVAESLRSSILKA